MTSSATATAIRNGRRGTHSARSGATAAGTPVAPALPVDKSLVHRAHLRDVLPTHLAQHSDTSFTVSASWPREHALYLTPDGRYTAALVLETIRQATLLVSHAGLGVPLGHHFVMYELSHRFEPGRLPAGPAGAPALTLDVEVTEVPR